MLHKFIITYKVRIYTSIPCVITEVGITSTVVVAVHVVEHTGTRNVS